jgi:hypothetical protein
MKFNELRNIKKAIGVWLGLESVAAFIYFVIAIVNGSNIFVALLLTTGLIVIPTFMYLLADAVLAGLLNGGYSKTIRTNVSENRFKEQNIEEELREFIPKTKYESTINVHDRFVNKEKYAFHKELKSVNIESDVGLINKQAFYGCENLQEIRIKKRGIIKLGKQALDKVSEKLKVFVHPNDLELYMGDPTWEPYMQYIYPYDIKEA